MSFQSLTFNRRDAPLGRDYFTCFEGFYILMFPNAFFRAGLVQTPLKRFHGNRCQTQIEAYMHQKKSSAKQCWFWAVGAMWLVTDTCRAARGTIHREVSVNLLLLKLHSHVNVSLDWVSKLFPSAIVSPSSFFTWPRLKKEQKERLGVWTSQSEVLIKVTWMTKMTDLTPSASLPETHPSIKTNT